MPLFPRPRRTAPPRPPFRPRLEALEDRRLLNASSVIDALGNHTIIVVRSDNSLVRYDQTGGHLLASSGVLRAHGYLQPNGQVGVIVVYTSFVAIDYDSGGGHFLGNNIIDADKAYDSAGHVQEDVTYSSGPGFITFEYTATGARQVAQGSFVALLIHPYRDGQGRLAEEVSYFNSVTSCTLIQYDSTGAHMLAQNAVADQAFDLAGQQFFLDVTYISNNAFEYTNTGATNLGNNIPI
jgi:hypothetical protein